LNRARPHDTRRGVKLAHVNDVVYAYASGNPAANGGAERYAWRLARALAAAGWTVTVGVHHLLEARTRVEIEGVEFVGLDRCHTLLGWLRFLKSERPDWWFWQCADYRWGPAVEVARVTGVRTIFSAMHDRDINPRSALFCRSRWWRAYAWGLTRTDRIFVQHSGQLSELAPRLRAKAAILPGIVTRRATVRPHAERSGYVAWVGVLRPHKRPDLLIDIARKMPGTTFLVCGGTTTFRTPAGYAEQIVAALRSLPNIQYLGQVDPATILDIIADAAVLLSTSDDEGLPSVFLEAWSGGTPVVSLHIDPDGAIRRLDLGAVSGTADGAVADLNRILASARLRDEIGRRCVRHVSDSHSPGAAVRVFEAAVASGGVWRER
jgi:glycosyltransferase involved in cell wall biosynthesis